MKLVQTNWVRVGILFWAAAHFFDSGHAAGQVPADQTKTSPVPKVVRTSLFISSVDLGTGTSTRYPIPEGVRSLQLTGCGGGGGGGAGYAGGKETGGAGGGGGGGAPVTTVVIDVPVNAKTLFVQFGQGGTSGKGHERRDQMKPATSGMATLVRFDDVRGDIAEFPGGLAGGSAMLPAPNNVQSRPGSGGNLVGPVGGPGGNGGEGGESRVTDGNPGQASAYAAGGAGGARLVRRAGGGGGGGASIGPGANGGAVDAADGFKGLKGDDAAPGSCAGGGGGAGSERRAGGHGGAGGSGRLIVSWYDDTALLAEMSRLDRILGLEITKNAQAELEEVKAFVCSLKESLDRPPEFCLADGGVDSTQ